MRTRILIVGLIILFFDRGSLSAEKKHALREAPVWAETQSIKEAAPLVLGKGEQRLLRCPGLLKYSLGSDAVHALRLPGNGREPTILVKGVRTGTGDLWVWKSDGLTEHRLIRVEALAQNGVPQAVERALSQLDEVEVLYAGPGVVLRGEIRTLPESARVAGIVRNHPKEVSDETEISDGLLAEGTRSLEHWILSSGRSRDLRVELQPGTLWVRGSIPRAAERPSVERAIRARFPKAELDLQSLPDDSPTIHFRVYLLELKKNRFGALGLDWPAFQEGAFRVTSGGVKENLQLDVALQALEGDGSARILSQPELVVRAPGEAELFAGGELPIRTMSKFSSEVSWKQFGLILKLKVSQVAGNLVRTDILTEVSHLDPSVGNDSIPGIGANRMKTQVDARFGVPLFLSGLLQEGTRNQARGLPLLRQIPVLGLLFGSEDYLNERSELVAILLPNSTPPPAPMDRIARFSPRGPLPAPRKWISPEEERAIRSAPDFPWNALQ